MNFKGTVTDKDGQILVGAHVVSNLRTPQVGTITDFNGDFFIGDARPEETWTIGHIGYEDILFKIPRNVTSQRFVMNEKAFVLDEVVLTPNKPISKPNEGPVFQGGVADQFRDLLDSLPKKEKVGFWDSLKSNPVAAIGFGALAFIVGGALLSKMARQSDKLENKRLGKA